MFSKKFNNPPNVSDFASSGSLGDSGMRRRCRGSVTPTSGLHTVLLRTAAYARSAHEEGSGHGALAWHAQSACDKNTATYNKTYGTRQYIQKTMYRLFITPSPGSCTCCLSVG